MAHLALGFHNLKFDDFTQNDWCFGDFCPLDEITSKAPQVFHFAKNIFSTYPVLLAGLGGAIVFSAWHQLARPGTSGTCVITKVALGGALAMAAYHQNPLGFDRLAAACLGGALLMSLRAIKNLENRVQWQSAALQTSPGSTAQAKVKRAESEKESEGAEPEQVEAKPERRCCLKVKTQS